MKPDSKLTGIFIGNQQEANVEGVLENIKAAREEETARIARLIASDTEKVAGFNERLR